MKTLIFLSIIASFCFTGCTNKVEPAPTPVKEYRDEVAKLLKLDCAGAVGNLPDLPVPKVPKKHYFKKGTSFRNAFFMQDETIRKLHKELYLANKNAKAFNALKHKKH